MVEVLPDRRTVLTDDSHVGPAGLLEAPVDEAPVCLQDHGHGRIDGELDRGSRRAIALLGSEEQVGET